MLSIFDGNDENRFVIWVKDGSTELELLISDGYDVWQSPHPITCNDKPASRKHEPDEIFLSQLRKALKRDIRDTQGAFEVEIKLLDNDIQLVIKETIGTTTTKSILFKTILERSLDSKSCFLRMFSQASEKMQNDMLEMISLNKSITDFTVLVESLSNNTKDMTTLKEKLHDELISKFCMVLNTKKREIERLNDRIEELESQYESVPNTQNTQPPVGVVDLTSSSQPARVLKTAKAPRGRAAPKTTTIECVTGKRKAAAKAAPASKKATVRKNSKRRAAESESEDELDDTEPEDEEVESETSSLNQEGSDEESDVFDDSVPTVTQGSVPGTQPSASNTPQITRNSRRGNAGGSSSSGGAVVVSLPIAVADAALLQSVAEEESEEELLHSRPRLARGVAKESPAPKVVEGTSSGTHAVSHVPAKPVTQHSQPAPLQQSSAGAAASKSGKSKFYAEDSDEEDNCLDYL